MNSSTLISIGSTTFYIETYGTDELAVMKTGLPPTPITPASSGTIISVAACVAAIKPTALHKLKDIWASHCDKLPQSGSLERGSAAWRHERVWLMFCFVGCVRLPGTDQGWNLILRGIRELKAYRCAIFEYFNSLDKYRNRNTNRCFYSAVFEPRSHCRLD